MTKWECAVVMTYTDTCMLQGEDLGIFYEYVNSLMGRPVCTHEIPALEEEIRKRAKKDFEEICRSAGEDPWNPISKKEPPKNTPLWLTIKTRSGWKPAVVAGVLHDDGWELIPDTLKEFTVTAWTPFLDAYRGGGDE